MKKTIATPVRLQKANLTDSERQELESKYGDQPMSDEELAAFEEQRKLDEQTAKEAEKEQKHAEVKAALKEIDAKSIRALREGNSETLVQLEKEAVELRKALKE